MLKKLKLLTSVKYTHIRFDGLNFSLSFICINNMIQSLDLILTIIIAIRYILLANYYYCWQNKLSYFLDTTKMLLLQKYIICRLNF